MWYVGKDDTHLYLRCSKCHQIKPYDKKLFSAYKWNHFKGGCSSCGKQYRHLWGYFTDSSIHTMRLYLATILFMAVLISIFYWPFLLKSYIFNTVMVRSSTLLSIFIPLLAAVVPLIPGLIKKEISAPGIRYIVFLSMTAFVMIFALFFTFVNNYSSVIIPDKASGTNQQYFGAVNAGQPSGKGRLFDSKGNLIYYGSWLNGKYDGYGQEFIVTQLDGAAAKSHILYEGGYAQGMREGFGKLYDYTKQAVYKKDPRINPYLIYEGNFVANTYCGQGTRYTTASMYTGGFSYGEKDGFGSNYWDDDGEDSKYTGVYHYGECRGIKYYSNGVKRYEGFTNSTDGRFHGKGIAYWRNGNIRFDGSYNDGLFQGSNCIEYYENGRKKYEGSYKQGKYDGGMGKLYFDNEANQLQYEGSFKEGEYDGANGKEYYENGTLKYEGAYSKGMFEGYGKLYFQETGKLRYSGKFSNGKKDGFGKEFFESGNIRYEGSFKEGGWNGSGKWYWDTPENIVYYDGYTNFNKKTGQAKKYYSDGTLEYDGEFENDKYHGEGTLYNEDGTIKFAGQFKDGEPVENS